MQHFVTYQLGPLLQYDRLHGTDLCATLRVLHRIAELLGRDLDDVEVRLALAVALRIRDVQIGSGEDRGD